MVLPAVCLAGIEPDPSFSPSRTTGNFSTEENTSLGGGCRQVPLEDHQALHKDPCVLLKQARRVKTPWRTRASKKHGHILPTLPLLGVLQPAGPVRRRQWCSLQKGTPEDDPVFPRWKLSKPPQSRTNTYTPSQAFPPGLGAPSVFPGLTGTASLCNISYSSLLTSFVKGN